MAHRRKTAIKLRQNRNAASDDAASLVDAKGHEAVLPPFTRMICPVIKFAFGTIRIRWHRQLPRAFLLASEGRWSGMQLCGRPYR
jgi:hypothetical protein